MNKDTFNKKVILISAKTIKTIDEILCEENTSYYGDILSSTKIVKIGELELTRNFRSWGAGLEYDEVTYEKDGKVLFEIFNGQSENYVNMSPEILNEIPNFDFLAKYVKDSYLAKVNPLPELRKKYPFLTFEFTNREVRVYPNKDGREIPEYYKNSEDYYAVIYKA